MSIRAGIHRAFRLLPRGGGSVAAQVDDEIALHLELRAERLERQGMSPEEARREAARRFGSLDEARRDLRRRAAHRERTMRTRERVEAIGQDLRYALRALRRERGFSFVVVLTLALGIGANAAMFGVLDRLLLSGPAHVVDADRVLRLYGTDDDRPAEYQTSSVMPYATYATARTGTTAFSHLAAYGMIGELTMGHGEEAERVTRRHATATLFPLLGVRPALGRFYDEAEDTPPTGAQVVVLDHGFWRRRFGGDSTIVGRTIELEGKPFTVVGVAPRGFTGPELEPVSLWLPMSSQLSPPTADWPTTRDAMWLQVIGRLAPGATPERAAQEVTLAERGAMAATGAPERELDVRMSARPLRFDRSGNETLELAVSRWLLGVAAVVLLVACANVANLLLARTVRRRREVAVRLALGIGRARLVRLLVAEGMLLALAGGAAGLLLATWGGQLLRTALLENVSWDVSPLDGRVLAVAAGMTVLTGLLVSLVPALHATRPDLVRSLKEGTQQGGGVRSRLRGALTVAQAAMSVVLLVGAGLFVLSLQHVRDLRLGIDTDRVLWVDVQYPRSTELPEAQREAELARRAAFRAELFEQLRRVPGVAATAMATGVPFHSGLGMDVRAEGVDSMPALPGGGPYYLGVTPDYLKTAGTRLLRGRGILPTDGNGGEHVALVNETMARTLWPTGDAIGKCLYVGDDTAPCSRVVGVVEDARRFALREEPAMQYYVPLSAKQPHGAIALVRAARDPAALVPVIQRHVRTLDPNVRHVNVQLMQDKVNPQMRPWRLGATMFGLFGALALVVAAVGLYSVMSYTAAQRTHEMGVRLALGAQPRDVRRLVLRSGVGLAALGVGIGVLGALAGGRWAEPLLFGISPRDPAVIGGVTLVLLVVAVLASLVPAWRSARVAPSVALRAE
jgi:predicted permease